MIFGVILEKDNNEYSLGDTIQTNDDNEYTLDDNTNEGEPDDDTGDEPTKEDNPDDNEYSLEDNPDDTDDETGEDNPDDTDDETGEDNPDDNEYSLEDNPDDTDDETGEDNPDDDMTDAEVNELVEKEKELFANITPEQMSIKDKELKTNFSKLYMDIEKIIYKCKKVSVSQENQRVFDFINKKLKETLDSINEYVYNTYSSKSYLQNLNQYNIYIIILKNIEKLFNELKPKNN